MKVLDDEAFRKRQQARERLPAWLRLVLPIVLLSFALGTAALIALAADRMFIALHPDAPAPFLHRTLTWTQGLLLFPPLMIGIPWGVVAGNLFLSRIPPVRRILDRNAHGVPGASFSQGMAAGRRAMLVVAVPGLALTLFGIWSPWLGR